MLIRTIKTLIASLGAGLVLAAPGASQAADPGIGDNTITLGMSAPVSGPNGAYGKEMKEGALAYFTQLNAAGGIGGKKIELLTLDDGYETEKTVANTRKLINDNKVFALMAFYGSSPTTESIKVFAEAKVPLLGTISGAGSLRSPVNRYMFHLRASYADETEAIVIIWSASASPTSRCSIRMMASANPAWTASSPPSPATNSSRLPSAQWNATPWRSAPQ